MNKAEIILAGFGGQGILFGGQVLAYAGMYEGKNVSWFPTYGPEIRGGTANCHIVISNSPVGCPVLSEANVVIVMSIPSLEKFEKFVKKDGLVFIDSSIIDKPCSREDVRVYEVPSTKLANELGSMVYSNVILMGRMIAATGLVSKESFLKALQKVLPERKHSIIPKEMEALEIGLAYR